MSPAAGPSDTAARLQSRIRSLLAGADASLRAEFLAFLARLQSDLNPAVTEDQAIEMLAQHLVTRPIFDALFVGHVSSSRNPVSKIVQPMVDALDGTELSTGTDELDTFYTSARRSIAGIADPAGKQTLIKRLYQDFFAVTFSATSERDGVVYTPNEIVDFILRSADRVLRAEFGQTLADDGVHILDPFTGTGTFIVNLLRSGLISRDRLAHKYLTELHANEMNLLAYHVAAVNIEESYRELTGGDEEPFPGIVLTDTFESAAGNEEAEDGRDATQNRRPLTVIVGNPPYSSGQGSANDNNRNPAYPHLDARIEATYAARSSAQNKNSLYDSYIRAIRWASDRIGERGVIAFVTNGGYLDGNAAAGLRQTLLEEASSVHVVNLRGNSRITGEQARREGGNVMGVRVGLAIILIVKNPRRRSHSAWYWEAEDYASKADKLALLAQHDVTTLGLRRLEPNAAGDWINARSADFDAFTPLVSKDEPHTLLRQCSAGLKSTRDSWVYASSRSALDTNVSRMLGYYERQRCALKAHAISELAFDARRIAWGSALRHKALNGVPVQREDDGVRLAAYRPFQKQFVEFSKDLNERRYRLAALFPSAGVPHPGFYLTAPGSGHPFAVLMIDAVPDLAFWGSGSGQFLPRYRYAVRPDASIDVFGRGAEGPSIERVDNVTDEILAEYRTLYGARVSKDDVFGFVYGILHSPEYRERYASDLKKTLPRIPRLAKPEDFWAFSGAGSRLGRLHRGYETVAPHPLREHLIGGRELHVERMRYAGKPGAWDKTTVIYNEHITLSGIPLEAQDYLLGSRSALDWIIDRYRVRVDKASGIRNDPNDWGREHNDPGYILTLLKRIVTVSLETMRIVRALPGLTIRSEG